MDPNAIYSAASKGIPEGAVIALTFTKTGFDGVLALRHLIRKNILTAESNTIVRIEEVIFYQSWGLGEVRTIYVRATPRFFDLGNFVDELVYFLDNVEFNPQKARPDPPATQPEPVARSGTRGMIRKPLRLRSNLMPCS